MSHENTVFRFENNRATMVFGKNETNIGQRSNGSGKTAFITAIVKCVIDENFSGVKDIEMIMDEIGEAHTWLVLQNPESEQLMRIERWIFASSKPQIAKVHMNGAPQDHVNDLGVKGVNKWILEQLDIAKEDFLNYFIIHKDNYTSFLAASDTEKKKVINRFSRANLIDKVLPKLEKDIAEKQKEIQKLERDFEDKQSRISLLKEQIEEAKEAAGKFEETKESKLTELEQIIVNLTKQQERERLNVKEKASALQLAQNAILELPDLTEWQPKIQLIEKKIALVEKDLKGRRKDLQQAEEIKAEANLALLGLIECPNCHHEFDPNQQNLDIEQARAEVAEVDEVIAEIKQDIENYKTELKALETQREKYEADKRTAKKKVDAANDEVKNKQRELTQANNELGMKKSLLAAHEKSLAEVKALEMPEDQTDRLVKRIEELENEAGEYYHWHQEKLRESAALEEWETNFVRFKSHLANKSISVISGYANMYLEKIKSDLQIQIDGYKTVGTGKKQQLREQITTNVLRDGELVGNFKKFSSGERGRIDICTILANQRLINLNSKSGGLNLLICDEVLDSVDDLGLFHIIHALNQIEQTIIVVTLGNFNAEYEYKVLIRKRNKISEIVTEEDLIEA